MSKNNEKRDQSSPLKKTLAVATVVASLGLSLGVPVADLMADDATPSATQIKVSKQDKWHNSQQSKVSNQTKVVEDLTNKKDLTSKQDKFNVAPAGKAAKQ